MKKEKEKKNRIIFLNSDPTWLGFINIKAPNFLSLYILFAFIHGFAASLVPGWNQATCLSGPPAQGWSLLPWPQLIFLQTPEGANLCWCSGPKLCCTLGCWMSSRLFLSVHMFTTHKHASFPGCLCSEMGCACVCVCVPLDYKTNDNGFFLTHSFFPGAPALQVPRSSTGGSSGNPGTGWLLWQKRQARPGRPGSLCWGARETAHLGNFLRKKTSLLWGLHSISCSLKCFFVSLLRLALYCRFPWENKLVS